MRAARAARLFFLIEPMISLIFGVVVARAARLVFLIEPIISLIFGVVAARAARLFFALSLHVQHDYFSSFNQSYH